MKNLHQKKKRLTARLCLAFVIALAQLPVIFGVRALFPDFFNKEPKLITVCIILAFTLAGLIVLVKTMNPFAIVEAMIKNEKRLKTDRRYWKSNNRNISVSSVAASFENGGFSVSLSEVSDGTTVAIGENCRWKALNTESGDEVLVYFDDSNRAEYLAGMVEPGPYGQIFWYGQRYILTYAGSSQALLEFLHSL